MTDKQIEAIKRVKSTLMQLGECDQPKLAAYIAKAICNGESPKLRSAKEISDNARKRILSTNYDRDLPLSQIFETTVEYERDMRAWNAYQNKRKLALDAFTAEAEAVIVLANDPTASGPSCVQALHEAAKRNGLKDFKPPTFE